MRRLRGKMMKLRVWVAAAMLTGAAGSCGGKTPATNGETHFLCAKDADCLSVGPAYTCKSGYCQIENASNDDGGDSSEEAQDFAACVRPPPSICSREQTCKQLGCGGLEFEATGCARVECTDDTKCGARRTVREDDQDVELLRTFPG